MKNYISSLHSLAIIALASLPLSAQAAPALGSPYYTDITNSYVQDQTSEVMKELNNILCFMEAMAPELVVNGGNYIALVDGNICETGGSGGQSANKGSDYTSVVVNSSRTNNNEAMKVKVWLDFSEPGFQHRISVYATASQSPTPTQPYGSFRMDFCGKQGTATDCLADRGFIDASPTGLSFYSGGFYSGGSASGSGGTPQAYSTALKLNASSSTSGSGVAQDVDPKYGDSTFSFAYNLSHFVRSDATGINPQCFDRSASNAKESVWRYGLYDATTGAQINRNSGFPIEYTVAGTTYNGYIGYHGLQTEGVAPGDTVSRVSYSSSGPSTTPYTLKKTGGKLHKYSTVLKTLADLNKVTFWYFAPVTIPATGTAIMTQGAQYELYWNSTTGTFMVSGKQGMSGNMEPMTPVAVANADMVAANPWGLYGWSPLLGGQFGIKGSEFKTLTGATQVVTQTEDVIYPTAANYAAIGNLICINDCPTVALIAASADPFANSGWAPVTEINFKTYTLNATSGNMQEAAVDVVSTTTSGQNANGIRSGRLVTAADKTAMIAAKIASGVCGGTGTGACDIQGYNQGDVDFLPAGSSYYMWETGAQSWNQLAILLDGATPIVFDAPLPVNFSVPADTSKYGTYAGATISLQYGGFGDLWGIPNQCIDVSTNEPCVFSVNSTPDKNQRWTSVFSIPSNENGVVTSGSKTYWVKALDKEVRLSKVALASCGGLVTPVISSVILPVVADWQDPTVAGKTPGEKPVVTTAPKVIHGVKQY